MQERASNARVRVAWVRGGTGRVWLSEGRGNEARWLNAGGDIILKVWVGGKLRARKAASKVREGRASGTNVGGAGVSCDLIVRLTELVGCDWLRRTCWVHGASIIGTAEAM